MEFLALLFIALAIAFYFLPTIIASKRKVAHENAILWINILFGWTILGWIVAAIWAVTEKSEPVPVVAPVQSGASPEPKIEHGSQDSIEIPRSDTPQPALGW